MVNQSAPLDVNFDPQNNLIHSLQLNQLALPPAPTLKALPMPSRLPTGTLKHFFDDIRGDYWIFIND